MSQAKPVYSPQYRQQLVELVLSGRSTNDVAKEFGLHATTVAKWVRLARMGTPVTLRQVQMERDILAKATAWFAGKSEKTSTPSTNS